ncbi:dixin-like [Uloborus diversus]|uniref:dixin-like n=1 Tax=Uloborus diversus TaxID=327109 RepID=UPI0024093335|nr:dixin-like [Uloborus diversus]
MTSSSWQEWTARLRAYVGWLNSQLRKEEGSRRVSDLRNDLRDGVILAQLVATLGGDVVPGIDPHPRTESHAKENVERLFRFLIRKGVPLHAITPKEVCDGDLKAIMRLVHAVASHYKPDTVLNPPRPIVSRKEEVKPPKKSCKVSPLQFSSNLRPQQQNSKSEPSSLDDACRISEVFVEQLLKDVQLAKRQLLLLQETLSNGKLERTLSLQNTSIPVRKKS